MSKRGRDVPEPSSSALPLQCLPPVPPQWITALVSEMQGTGLQFLMEKTIDPSDVDHQQNRLRIPVDHVRDCILPMLLPHELEAANLDVDPDLFTCSSKKKIKSSPNSKKMAGRAHGGLEVCLYNRARWRFDDVCLVRWDSNNSTILKGRGWHPFYVLSNLQVGETVQMWGFRTGDENKLCLVIAKIASHASSTPVTKCTTTRDTHT